MKKLNITVKIKCIEVQESEMPLLLRSAVSGYFTTTEKGEDYMKGWNYKFNVPDEKKVRMIVCTDCKNEADDQFALAHHLMTPKLTVKGIVGGHFNLLPLQYGEGRTAQASVDEIYKILGLMELQGEYPVFKGAELPMEDEQTERDSEGARFIIEEAMKEDPHPLFVACQGAITDLASAILMKPEIADRLTAIWIGGGEYPRGGEEFNLKQDIAAANVVMKSRMPLWQVPINIYKKLAVSLAEIQWKVRPCGAIGNYLFERMTEVNDCCAKIPGWPHGEIWGLGDSAAVGLLLMEEQRTDAYEEIQAPSISYEDMTYSFENENRMIRVYKEANERLTLEDFFSKLQLNYGDR